MTTLATIRSRLQTLLDDAGAVFWSTAELDQHIASALRDLSHYIPRQRKSTTVTVAGSREVNISALTDRVRVVAFELPNNNSIETFRRFRVWGDILYVLDDPVPDGSNADIWYEAMHTLNGGSTFTEDVDEILVYAAAWLACNQQAADATNSINTGGSGAGRDWSSLARHYREQYERRRNARRGIRESAAYVPIDQETTQSSDPGP